MISMYRDEIDATQIGDIIDRYELGDLHMKLWRIPIPCWLGMLLLFPVMRTLQYSKRGSYKGNYKQFPKINGVYTPPEALIAEGYYAGCDNPSFLKRSRA